MSRPRRRARSTRAASSATRSSHAFGAAFDNPDLIVAVRRRRRRGRDRAAGRELALQQVPQPGPRRRGAADPAPERLQDRQPDGARAHPRGGAPRAARGLRLRAATGRHGRRPGHGAPAAGGRRSTARSTRSPPDPGGRAAPVRASARPSGRALADDRAAVAQGLDRARTVVDGVPVEGTWRSHQVPLSGARRRTPSTSRAAREVAAQLPARGALRRGRRAARRDLLAQAPARRPPHEREPARQRRPAPARPATCPTSATTPSTVPAPGRTSMARRPACSARSCAT